MVSTLHMLPSIGVRDEPQLPHRYLASDCRQTLWRSLDHVSSRAVDEDHDNYLEFLIVAGHRHSWSSMCEPNLPRVISLILQTTDLQLRIPASLQQSRLSLLRRLQYLPSSTWCPVWTSEIAGPSTIFRLLYLNLGHVEHGGAHERGVQYERRKKVRKGKKITGKQRRTYMMPDERVPDVHSL